MYAESTEKYYFGNLTKYDTLGSAWCHVISVQLLCILT